MSDDILGDIKDEMEAFGDELKDKHDTAPDRDGVYDPVDDVDRREPVPMDWPSTQRKTRSLTAEQWGMRGEGTPRDWERFAMHLNSGRLGSVEAELIPDFEERWSEPNAPFFMGDMNERGKHLYVELGVSPATMLKVEGTVGENDYGTPKKEFITPLDPKVLEYKDMFERGEVPGNFFAYLNNDLELTGPQEGRHRAGAALLAGIDYVPAYVLMKTEDTFQRVERWRKPDGPGYRANYEPL